MAYLSIEVFTPNGRPRTRGYVAPKSDARFLALVARDSLRALQARGQATEQTRQAQTLLEEQIRSWNLRVILGQWSGERKGEV